MGHYKFFDGKLVECTLSDQSVIIFVHTSNIDQLPSKLAYISQIIKSEYTFNAINKFELINDSLLLSLTRIAPSDNSQLSDATYHCIVNDKQLYFVHDDNLDLDVYLRAINNITYLALKEVTDYENMIYLVLLELLNYDKTTLEAIDEQCFNIETLLLDNNDAEYFLQVLSAKKTLAEYKKAYFGLEEIFLSITSLHQNLLSTSVVYEFDRLSNRMRWLSHEINSLIDYTGQLRDLYHTLINESMNRTMNFFTVISAIFLPLTLLVGWYGMNFRNMPELEWEHGYIFVIALSMLIVSLLLFIYKKKKYL